MKPPKHKKTLMYRTLKILFENPIVILMLGDWRQGKTDTSLLIAYLAKKWGLIDKIGTNIWTFNDPDVDHIPSLQKLRTWLHFDRLIKLFIFDEGLKHVYRRTAMSKKNVGVIEILAELSKGHGRMIVCSQIDKIDTDILNPAFTRAVFVKKAKKVMFCKSKHFKPRTFYNLPKSPIKFDPDKLAPFISTEVSKKTDLEKGSEIYEVARFYSKGKSLSWIKREMDLHPEKVKRDIRKALALYLEYEDIKREEEGESKGIEKTVTSPK